jgi:Zn-dependent peptidase ImmA (M78 family)
MMRSLRWSQPLALTERRAKVEKSEMSIVARHLTGAPVDLKAVFADLGIEYREVWMDDGASGCIIRNGDKFTVEINALESATRQRFTAAHELAHYLLHRDLMHVNGSKMNRHTDRLYGAPEDNPSSPFTRRHEIEANRLAAQIVMPAALVRSKFEAERDSSVLAGIFGVSKAAMDIRLKTLGLT